MKLDCSINLNVIPEVDCDVLSTLNWTFQRWQIRDRFNILNPTSNILWIPDAEEKPTISTSSITDLVDARATEIIKNNEDKENPIVVSWSGGVDSTSIVCALLKNGCKNFKVVFTEASIEEYPWFYENIIKKNCNYDLTDDIHNDFRNIDCSQIVTGWCADQLFGSNIHLHNLDLYNVPVIDGIREHYKRVYKERRTIANQLSDSSLDLIATKVNELGSYLGLTINKFCEFAWLYNFAIKWVLVRNVTNLELMESKNQGKGLAFFNTQGFQDWSYSRYDTLADKNVNKEVKYYKRPLKKYIYDYTKDGDYLENKGKVNSWRVNHGKGSDVVRFTAITDEGTKIWKPKSEDVTIRDFFIYCGNKFRKNPYTLY